jgi:hypothetical protein
VWKILQKCLAVWIYQLQVLQPVTPHDRVVYFEFCGKMIDHIAEDETLLSKVCSSNEATGLTPIHGEVKIRMPWMNI